MDQEIDMSLCTAYQEDLIANEFLRVGANSSCRPIVVESLCKGFSKLEKEEVFSWASINEIIEGNSHFEDIHIDIENEITSKVIKHALEDLHYKNVFYGPITGCLDASDREYISSISLDYAILYENFFLLITEAKKDQLENGIIQNIAQLVASREQFLYNCSSLKRNYMSMAGDIACIPSTGVVSTGKEWVLIRYVLLPKPAVFKSSPMSLPLGNGSLAELRQYLLLLLSKLLGAIDLQKKLVDERILAKAQKSLLDAGQLAGKLQQKKAVSQTAAAAKESITAATATVRIRLSSQNEILDLLRTCTSGTYIQILGSTVKL
eukprot:gene30479-39728_t